MSQTRDVVVEAQHVSRRYGSGETAVDALRQVDLSVRAGERIAVVGPSGSGKSTLLGILGLIDHPDEGWILIDGQEVAGLGEDQQADLRRSHIGLVFQTFLLIPALTAIDNVLAPLIPYGLDRRTVARAQELLEIVGLGDRMTHRPGQLSGGEQQRVAIARALINAPHLVLADELTGNLDSGTADKVMDALDVLQDRFGFGLVVATHDDRVAARMQRIVRLHDGAVAA